jgi:hypothetical protein
MKNIFIQIYARIKGHLKTTVLGVLFLATGLFFVYLGKATFSEFAASLPVVIALLLSKDDSLNKIIEK